jgi:hypothetical protein
MDEKLTDADLSPVRWVDICRSLRIMGYMKDFSKAECFRVANELKKRVEAGEARKIKRGTYAVAAPKDG